MYIGKSMTEARQNANYLASFFQLPYVIFTDTSGNLRCERYDARLTCHREGEVICTHPNRNMNGGCDACGDPCF